MPTAEYARVLAAKKEVEKQQALEALNQTLDNFREFFGDRLEVGGVVWESTRESTREYRWARDFENVWSVRLLISHPSAAEKDHCYIISLISRPSGVLAVLKNILMYPDQAIRIMQVLGENRDRIWGLKTK